MQNCEHDFVEQCRAMLAFSNLTSQMLVLRAMSVATLESFIPIFPHKLFSESLRVQDVVTFLNINVKLHEFNYASKVYINGFRSL